MFCVYCNKECKNNNSLRNHERLCKENPDRILSSGNTGNKSWNNGLTKDTDIRVKKQSEVLTEGFESGRIKKPFENRTHSEETKKKISESRKLYLDENPDKVPYLLNHYSKGESYPEGYFRELFNVMGLDFIQEKREGLYSLDFVVGNLNIEIDGEQHYVDTKIVASDIRRTEYLEKLGYSVRRVRWRDYQKLSYEEKEIFIQNLINN